MIYQNILLNNITDLNELIHEESKLVREKFVIFLRNTNKSTKVGWEMILGQIKKLREQAKL